MQMQQVIAAVTHALVAALVATPDLTTPAWRAVAHARPLVGLTLVAGVTGPPHARLARLRGLATRYDAAPLVPGRRPVHTPEEEAPMWTWPYERRPVWEDTFQGDRTAKRCWPRENQRG